MKNKKYCYMCGNELIRRDFESIEYDPKTGKKVIIKGLVCMNKKCKNDSLGRQLL